MTAIKHRPIGTSGQRRAEAGHSRYLGTSRPDPFRTTKASGRPALVKGTLAKPKPEEGMTVLGVFRTYREAVNALVELRERFSAADIAVIVRYRGKPVPVGLDITAISRQPDYCDSEFWASPTCVFVRANGRAHEVQTYFSFCGAQRVETRDPRAPATPL